MTVPAGLYLRYRCSPLCEWMSRLRGTSHAKSMDVDREFFGAFFVAHGIRRVFDIGANVGDKSVVFSEHADSVLCVEADPMIARGLKSRFIFRKRVTVRNVAVGAAVGTATLFRKNHSGFSTLSEKWSQAVLAQGVVDNGRVDVPVTTLDLLMDEHGIPDYLKIAIEGHELPAVRGLNRPVRAVSFEANLPTFYEETVTILDMLLKRWPEVRFNLRVMDAPRFHLEEFVAADQLVATLASLSPVTSDVFAVGSPI